MSVSVLSFTLNFILYFSFFVGISLAQLKITEVLPNPTGSDKGREFIEIVNVSGSDFDLSDIKIRTRTTNHRITSGQTDTVLPNNGVAIITEDKDKFRVDYPNSNGLLIRFPIQSILNDGAFLIVLLDSADLVINQFDYILGPSYLEGNSIHKDINNVYTISTPTPFIQDITNVNNQLTESTSSSRNKRSINIKKVEKKKVVGYRIVHTPKAFLKGISFEISLVEVKADGTERYPKTTWNFGDGVVKIGANVFHKYKHIGDYIITAQVPDDNFVKLYVNVKDSEIELQKISLNFVSIKNKSDIELDISGWIVESKTNKYEFKPLSFIKEKTTIVIEFESSKNEVINLLNPFNDVIAKCNNCVFIKKNTELPKLENFIKKDADVITKDFFKKKEEIKKEVEKEEFLDSKKDYKNKAFIWISLLIGLIFIAITPILFLKSK